MRRTALLALAVLPAALYCASVASARNTDAAQDAARSANTVERWYRLSVHFLGSYEEVGRSNDFDLSAETKWTAETVEPFKIVRNTKTGVVTFRAKLRGKVESASWKLRVDEGEQCLRAATMTRKTVGAISFTGLITMNGVIQGFDPAVGPFPPGLRQGTDRSYVEQYEFHCSGFTPSDYVSGWKTACLDSVHIPPGLVGNVCLLTGSSSDVLATRFFNAYTFAPRFAFDPGKKWLQLGRDFSYGPTLGGFVRRKPSISPFEHLKYGYDFEFQVCPGGGLTRKGC